MSINQTIFPRQENDPFDSQVTDSEEPSTLWSTSTPLPRWQLLTDQEQKDRDSVLRKLESKLKKLDKKKERPEPNYTDQIIPDSSYQFESESEQDEDDHNPVDEEGLPLLWKSRSIDLDAIPRKTEDQYSIQWSVGVSHTVIGAISAIGVVNLSTREFGNAERKKVAPQDRLSVPKDTTGGHYLRFLNDTMDIMDEFPEMRGCFIVMDNTPIHIPKVVDPIIINRGYTPVYLPPYSPELNTIEQF
ncbi:hypothetical protein HPULCUR_010533 [Helicostylum pulchrum]|uniref:Tc1-like transposase DDE domain-containing protein n=1 Tax=Helicostylum pulchrum TaxID=562976 RepID=A0ABP9YDI0_9FUNG